MPDSEAGMMKWFGQAWPSTLCEDCPRVPTPVGAICSHCAELIAEDDTGVIYANGPVAHRNCFLRGWMGSVAHIRKRCSCFVPGSDESDPPGMTRRQAADAAVAEFILAEKRALDKAREIYPPIFTIYHRPKDFPSAEYLVRPWYGKTPDPAAWVAPTLRRAREIVREHGGSMTMEKDASDDPVIVESWI